MTIEFFRSFTPPTATPQQRRFNRRGGFLPPRAKLAAAVWQAAVEPYAPEQPIEGPVRLLVTLTWPHTRLSRPRGPAVPKTTRPDGDNLLKMLKDVLTKCRFWHDDAQVYSETIERFYGEIPGMFLKIQSMEESQK